jgi:hypothetical protein
MSLAEDLRILDLLEERTDKTDRTGVLSVLSGPSLKHPQILASTTADRAYAADALRRAENALLPVEDEAELCIRGELTRP